MDYMEQHFMIDLFGRGGMDWATVIAFAVVALVYFLAPWAGYTARGRGMILAALWVLLAKVGVGMLALGIAFLATLDKSFRGKEGEMLFLLIRVGESAIFLLGMVLFVLGLPMLKRETDLPPYRPGRTFED